MIADIGSLVTIASIISGFGIAMLYFRIQRELQMHDQMELNWIPWADRLLIVATLVSLLFVLLPVVLFDKKWEIISKIIIGSSASSIIMVVGYIFAILAHYRFLLGKERKGPRTNPEPAEKFVIIITTVTCIGVFIVSFFMVHS
jgi:hypothetical protein